MSATAGGRCRRSRADSMPSSGRRPWRHCRRTRAPRSKPAAFEDAMLAAPRRSGSSRRARSASNRSPRSCRYRRRPSAQANRGQLSPRCRTIRHRNRRGAEPVPAGARATAAGRIGPGRGRAAIPRRAMTSPRPALQHSGGHSHRARARRPGIDDETRRDEFAEQISPHRPRPAAGADFLSRWGELRFTRVSTRQRFSCQIGLCPISGASVSALPNARIGPPQ